MPELVDIIQEFDPTEAYVEKVFAMSGQGVTSVFISHNMHHVFACCDRIVAMALGQIVLDKPVSETSIEEVSEKL